MKVFYSLDDLPVFNKTVFTQGTFDGVHIGHQEILNQLLIEKQKNGGETLVMTFWPHPRLTLNPSDSSIKLLQTLEERIEKLRKCGIDNLIVLPFDKQFSQIEAKDFIAEILIKKLNIGACVFGYDHRFGKERKGDINLLKKYAEEYNFKVIEIDAQIINNVSVSSTKIRLALKAGDIKTANQFLGSEYTISGEVVEGRKIGRTIGFPTANILIKDSEKLLPKQGVYVVKSIINHTIVYGMLNIGTNPTFQNSDLKIEVHFFDFNKDLYHQTLTINILKWMREEKKFDRIEDLALYLQLDKQNAIEYIENI